jgi:hypothetical protein
MVARLGEEHHVYGEHLWMRRAVKEHPFLSGLKVEVDRDSYVSRNIQEPPSRTSSMWTRGLADTGAQMTIVGPDQLRELGVRRTDITPATMKIVTADDKAMTGAGMVLLKISATDGDGVAYTSRQQAYVMEEARHLFLSRECLEDLGVIGVQFPKIGAYRGSTQGLAAPVTAPIVAPAATPDGDWHPKEGCEEGSEGDERPCKCPVRTAPPDVPTVCPFEPVPENIEKLKDWIGKRYAGSAFNACTCQKLPLVTSSPPL